MRPLASALVLASFVPLASARAEIRVINGTGQDLVIDVLHPEKQERDIKLSTAKEISKTYGTPLEKDKSEMLVVRDATGKELHRESVQTDGIYAINNWGSGFIVNHMGRFQGWTEDTSGLAIINATGKTLSYKTELADFSLREGKGREPKDIHSITKDGLVNIGKEGEKRSVELSVIGSDTSKFDVVVGGLYFLTMDEKTLKLIKVR